MNRKIIRPLIWVPVLGMALFITLAEVKDYRYYKINRFWNIMQFITTSIAIMYLIIKS